MVCCQNSHVCCGRWGLVWGWRGQRTGTTTLDSDGGRSRHSARSLDELHSAAKLQAHLTMSQLGQGHSVAFSNPHHFHFFTLSPLKP